MHVVFSILHYQDLEVTHKCVQSILGLNNEKISTVIVDNGSTNGSGKVLKKLYPLRTDIHVINNKDNLGFAKGNNIGFLYAKKILNADIIIVINNDILVDKNFANNLLITATQISDVHIIAPDIFTKDGTHQNPLRYEPMSVGQFLHHLFYNVILLIIMYIPLLNQGYLKFLSNYKRNKDYIQMVKTPQITKNFVPHGAGVIFLPKYIAAEDIAFVPITFLFCEEDILFEYASRKNYKIIFDNSLVLHHLVNVSMKGLTRTKVAHRKFIARHKIKSLIAYGKYVFN